MASEQEWRNAVRFVAVIAIIGMCIWFAVGFFLGRG